MTEQTPERQPFGSEYMPKEGPIKGVKLKSENSQFTKTTEQKQQFEDDADAFMAQKRERNKQALTLAQRFIEIVRDKTLIENKTLMAKQFEQEVCSDLVWLCLDINEDDSEREGMGSAAMINLLLKVVLNQRDMLNSVGYKITQLEKQLSSLAGSLSSNDKK